MEHRWVRVLGAFQIAGAVLMFGFGISPRFGHNEFHAHIPIVTWVFASVAFLAGVLLVGRHRSGVDLSLAVQLAQVLSVSIGIRYVFLVGPKLTWVIAGIGTALSVGAGGLFAFLSPSPDGTLRAVGLGADVGWAVMSRPLAESPWTVGINLVALYFARRLWRLRSELAREPTASIAPRAVD